MPRNVPITEHTAEELEAMRQRGESRSDWTKAGAMTNDEIEASVSADTDEAGMIMDWDSASIEMPHPKAVLNMRVDQEVLDYFRKTGRGYQTRINAVLKSYVSRMIHDQH